MKAWNSKKLALVLVCGCLELKCRWLGGGQLLLLHLLLFSFLIFLYIIHLSFSLGFVLAVSYLWALPLIMSLQFLLFFAKNLSVSLGN